MLTTLIIVCTIQLRTEFDFYRLKRQAFLLPKDSILSTFLKSKFSTFIIGSKAHQGQEQGQEGHNKIVIDICTVRMSVVCIFLVGIAVFIVTFLIPNDLSKKLLVIAMASTVCGYVVPIVIISRNANMKHYCKQQLTVFMGRFYRV